MGIHPSLLDRFAFKMMNPVYYRRARTILKSYNYAALQDPYAVGAMVDSLCMAFGDTITPAQRAAAIRFVIAERVNPLLPGHRAHMRGLVFGY